MPSSSVDIKIDIKINPYCPNINIFSDVNMALIVYTFSVGLFIASRDSPLCALYASENV